ETVEFDDGIAITLGGVILAIDSSGSVRWVRSQAISPTDDDPRWVLQMFQRPLLKDGRLYVAQPGVRTVECVAAATGRHYWSAVLSDIVGIVGFSGDLLVVRTQGDLRGLNLSDGTTKWRSAVEELAGFPILDEQRLL